MNGGSRYTLFKKYLRSITWSLGMKPKFGNSLKNGEYGEWLGKKYLKRKGFKVRSVNWRSRRDRRNEIDLICMEREILVFVEIRARSVNSFTTGFESLIGGLYLEDKDRCDALIIKAIKLIESGDLNGKNS